MNDIIYRGINGSTYVVDSASGVDAKGIGYSNVLTVDIIPRLVSASENLAVSSV